MAASPVEQAVLGLLANHGAATSRTFAAARAKLMAVAPGAREAVRPGWGLLGFSAPRYFAFLAPQKDGTVRLGFEHGVVLDDQWGLLEGRGTQVRWITLRRPSEVARPGVVGLILQAVELASTACKRPASAGRNSRTDGPPRIPGIAISRSNRGLRGN